MTPRVYCLIGPDGVPYLSENPGTLGRDTNSVYGRLDCSAVRRALRQGDLYRRKRVFFADEATAVAAGYRPCGSCMREEHRAWRAAQG